MRRGFLRTPTFRLIGSEKIWDRGAALTSRLQSFETEMLAEEENFAGLARLNRALIGKAERRTRRTLAITESDKNIRSTVSCLNRHYVLCTTHPDADACSLGKKYGRFVVRINSPLVLLERIKVAWQSHELALEGCAFMCAVEYTKDELRDADPLLLSPPHLTYSQKPRSYEEDREYRYVLQCKVDVKRAWRTHLTLTLPDCGDICSALTVCAES